MEWPCTVRGLAIAVSIWAHLGVAFVYSPTLQSRSGVTSVTSERIRIRMGLADDMVPAICRRYGETAAGRVIDAWKRGMVGEVTRKEWEGKGSQVAASYVEGLEAEPWHNVARYPWIPALEKSAHMIRDELRRAPSENFGDNAAWVPAAQEDAEAYGPGWQKMVLQDRVWDSVACGRFPKTCAILEDCGAPSHEVFFARQRARSGIKPHTDNSNFFVTAHLPLEVPDGGRCWMKVGTDEKREWQEDSVVAFDSSFVHETRNDASSDRIILLVRFWHPQLTQVERSALSFIFSALEDPSVLDQPYDPVLDLKDSDSTGAVDVEPSLPVSANLGVGSGLDETTSTQGTGPAEEVTSNGPPQVPVPLPASLDGPQGSVGTEGLHPPQETDSAKSPKVESTESESVSAAGSVESQEAISVKPLGDAGEAERLDGFLADLKSEGLLPGAGTKDDVLAQGPKNRRDRRKASKARKKASRPGKGKKR
ncbi:unnamed protein product [Ectocarpus fasciculatus]